MRLKKITAEKMTIKIVFSVKKVLKKGLEFGGEITTKMHHLDKKNCYGL